jgi:hypothetical protein
MPTRGRNAVLSWELAGVMEHQIVAFGGEGGNTMEGDSRFVIRGSTWLGQVDPRSRWSLETAILITFLVNHNRDPSPVFFVSVASKGLNRTVSLLFATLARRPISVAAKGLKAIGWKYRMWRSCGDGSFVTRRWKEEVGKQRGDVRRKWEGTAKLRSVTELRSKIHKTG